MIMLLFICGKTSPSKTDAYLTIPLFHIILEKLYIGLNFCVRTGTALWTLILIGSSAVAVCAQTDESIIIEHADTWRGTGVDEQFDLIGHVRITHGGTTLMSDRVRYFRIAGKMALDGHVRVAQEDMTLRADHMEYFEQRRLVVADGAVALIDSAAGTTLTGTHAEYYHRPKRAIFTGSPRLIRKHGDDDLIITGQRFEYFMAETDSAKRAIAQDSVTVIDLTEQITVTCQRAVYTQAPERAELTGQPRLVKQSKNVDHPVIVTGGQMMYAVAEKRADVVDSVTVIRGGIVGVCDTMSYFSEADRARLTGQPALKEGNSELKGDEIILLLEDDTVTEAVITGNASGAYAPDNRPAEPQNDERRKSTIKGRQMRVVFDEDTAREITASQNAVSTYHPSAGLDAGPQGPNQVKANTITLILDHGRLIRVIAKGGVIGTYEAPRGERSLP